MALITRISRLFKADFHAVLDQVEEPRILLRQAIRDMEEDVSEAEHRRRQLRIDADQLRQRRDELEQALGENDEQLDICFESDEERLARDLIKRKLQTQGLSNRVSARLGNAEKELQSLGRSLDENRAALESLRQKADLFAQRAPDEGDGQNTADDIAWTARELSVSDSDVEVAFLREKKRRAQS
jgi:phage shock protein A